MPQLTQTSELGSLSYSLPDLQHEVTIHLANSSDPVRRHLQTGNQSHRILEVPVGSKWEPGAHWHEDYVEHIRVLRGRAKVWIDGTEQELGPGQEAVFRLFDVHNFRRAEAASGDVLLIEEWVDGEDGSKEIFFRNAFSIVRDVENFGGLPMAFLRFFVLCAYRDNHIAFCPPATPRWLQRLLTSCIFGVIVAVGKIGGWRTWYEEYTPPELRALAAQRSGRKEQ
ncbi:hypothetical protein NLU13_2137 [Sarocladium strictum]|uniref:Cupin type-2 domain-containing protein n=1 Tax=Sarocladium strictum TaxID=5046 RepID=A0AA39LCY4_SARSR|nr:hypothetical protein NLU13_2137 [Sarocladium strictum]